MAIDQARSCGSASWLAVGLSGGHAALADPRAGELGAFWRTHDAGLTCLAACSDHSVLTGSQVRVVTCTLERASKLIHLMLSAAEHCIFRSGHNAEECVRQKDAIFCLSGCCRTGL